MENDLVPGKWLRIRTKPNKQNAIIKNKTKNLREGQGFQSFSEDLYHNWKKIKMMGVHTPMTWKSPGQRKNSIKSDEIILETSSGRD